MEAYLVFIDGLFKIFMRAQAVFIVWQIVMQHKGSCCLEASSFL